MFEQKDEEGLGLSLLMKKRRMCRSCEISTRQKSYDTLSFKQVSSWREANNSKKRNIILQPLTGASPHIEMNGIRFRRDKEEGEVADLFHGKFVGPAL